MYLPMYPLMLRACYDHLQHRVSEYQRGTLSNPPYELSFAYYDTWLTLDRVLQAHPEAVDTILADFPLLAPYRRYDSRWIRGVLDGTLPLVAEARTNEHATVPAKSISAEQRLAVCLTVARQDYARLRMTLADARRAVGAVPTETLVTQVSQLYNLLNAARRMTPDGDSILGEFAMLAPLWQHDDVLVPHVVDLVETLLAGHQAGISPPQTPPLGMVDPPPPAIDEHGVPAAIRHREHRKALRLWRADASLEEIANQCSLAPQSVNNLINKLRKQFGSETVPYRKPARTK